MPQPTPQESTPTPRQPFTRNPLPLSASQEAQVKSLYYKKVRDQCATEIKEFAECARGRTITATWLCRAQRLAMNGCMISHATQVNEDAAREEWFASRPERNKKHVDDLDAVERRREEVIALIRKREEKERLEEEERKQKQTQKGGKGKGWWG